IPGRAPRQPPGRRLRQHVNRSRPGEPSSDRVTRPCGTRDRHHPTQRAVALPSRRRRDTHRREKDIVEEIDIQERDLFKDADAAIAFRQANQTWTITEAVLVSSSKNNGVFSEFDDSTLVNNGNILSGAANAAGVEMIGADSLVSNAAGARIVG